MTEPAPHHMAQTEQVFRKALASQPEVLADLTLAHETALAAVDNNLMALCEARIQMILGFPAVAAQDSAALNQETIDACIAFTEQFVIDVASMSDETVAAVSKQLGPEGLLNFTNALLVVEQRTRLHLMWNQLIPEVLS